MRISKKAEYALRALAILASCPPSRPVQIHELADKGQIPVKFLEQILLILKRAEILRSKRGIGGGYQLNRASTEISLAEVIHLMDGATTHEPAPQGGAASAPGHRGLCETLEELDSLISGFLEQHTIAMLLQREEPEGMIAFDI